MDQTETSEAVSSEKSGGQFYNGAAIAEVIKQQRTLSNLLTTLYSDATGDDIAKLVWGKWANDAADQLEFIAIENYRLISALKEIADFTEAAEDDDPMSNVFVLAANALPPNSIPPSIEAKSEGERYLIQAISGASHLGLRSPINGEWNRCSSQPISSSRTP